jgi:phosphoserine phosphatase RsbU/P
MKKHKLQKQVFVSFAIYALVMALCIGTLVVMQHLRTKRSEGRTAAFAFTKSAAEYIDGDTIETYMATKEADVYYTDIQRYFTSNVENSNLIDFYVGIPMEDGVFSLWDAPKTGSASQLGELIPYSEFDEGTKEYLHSIFCANPPEEIITGYENEAYIATACSPIFNSAGDPVAVVAADLLMPNVKTEIQSALFAVILTIILLVLLLAISFFAFVRKLIVLPIQRLNNASKSIVENLEKDEQPSIDIRTGNEIEELSDSFRQMYMEIRDYIQKLNTVTAEKQRIGAELDIAAKIQASMLPCIFPAFPNRKEFEIYATMDPAKEVGGDFYDFFMVDDEHLAIVVADVSGKGVPAALFMVIGKTLIKDHTGFQADLGDVFTEVNDILCASNSEEMFITAFEGVLNLKTGEFRYVNAGHETPFVCKKDGVYEPFKIKAGFVLAGMEDMRYKGGSMLLSPGDKLFQYTDGVTEATDASNQLYGMARLERVLAKNAQQSPQEVLRAVKLDIDAFVGEAPQFDDITMLCLRYQGGEKNE